MMMGWRVLVVGMAMAIVLFGLGRVSAQGAERVDSVTFTAGENKLVSAVVSPDGDYAYYGTDTSPGIVVKVRLSDMTRVSSVTLNEGENNLISAVVSPDGAYAYFGACEEYGSPGIVVKVRLSDMTRVSSVTFNKGAMALYAAVVSPDGAYAYFGSSSAPGIVTKVRLSDMTSVGSVSLYEGEDGGVEGLNVVASAVMSPDGTFAYFGTWSTYGFPSRVVKVRLSDLTLVSSVTLNEGENDLTSAVVSPDGDYAYFGSSSTGIVVKVRLSDMTRVRSVTADHLLTSAVVSPDGAYAYFGTDTSPGIVVKLRLSDMKRVSSLTLNGGENYLASAVVSPDGAYAYFGTYTSPASVIRVRLGPQPVMPAKVKWSRSSVGRGGLVVASFLAAANTTYQTTASLQLGKQTRALKIVRGLCVMARNKKTKQRVTTCTIRLNRRGTWLVAITPFKVGVQGTPSTKRVTIKKPAKKPARMLLAHHLIAWRN
jgi:Tol biopolymer transport system component